MEEETVRPLVPRRNHKRILHSHRTAQVVPAPSTSPTPATPRSILKRSNSSTLVGNSESSESTAPSSPPSSSSSSTATSPKKTTAEPHDGIRRVPTGSMKEKAFFAFVLLPLSCWYTRGGSRLRELEESQEDPFRPRQLERRNSVPAAPKQPMRIRRRGTVGIDVSPNMLE